MAVRLRQLEYFVAICECGSFTAASAQLYVAQPSLSQQIRALEKEVGAELLERGQRGVSLTAAGRAFLPHARAALQATQEARRAVANVTSGGEGELNVVTVRSVASGVLPAPVGRWHDRYPGTILRLHDCSHRRDLETAVREGKGDLAIGPRPLDWEGPVESIGFEHLVVAGGNADAGGVATVAELAEAKWVHFEPEQGMSEVLEWVSASLGFTPRVAARVGQVAAALRLAVEGVGLAVVPENAVPAEYLGRVRSTTPQLFRELVAYSRSEMAQLTKLFVATMHETELPLVGPDAVPPDALVR